MRDRDRTYTMEELEAESGFDRRTVAYYVQEEILPRVGRRGPRTRYPRRFLDRLLFVRRVRELQDKGGLPPLTLAEIKQILDRLPPRTVAAVASGKDDVLPIVLGSGTLSRSLEDFDPAMAESRRLRVAQLGPVSDAMRAMQPELGRSDLAETVSELVEQAAVSRTEDSSDEGRWTTVAVTDDLLLTVRGDRPSALRLVERLARRLRELARR